MFLVLYVITRFLFFRFCPSAGIIYSSRKGEFGSFFRRYGFVVGVGKGSWKNFVFVSGEGEGYQKRVTYALCAVVTVVFEGSKKCFRFLPSSSLLDTFVAGVCLIVHLCTVCH